MKRLLFVFLVLSLATPLFAADHFLDIDAFAIWVDPSSSGTFNSTSPNQPFNIKFKGDLGWGVGANVYLGDAFSLQFTGSEVKPKANLSPFAAIAGGSTRVRMIPLTAVAQWHILGSGSFDPYVGAGACYVLFSNPRNTTSNLGLDHINFKNDVGLALNGGINIGFTKMIALYLDAKYVPLRSSATAVYTTGGMTVTKVKINPVMASAGLAFRF
jgi:outer membrane protein